MTCSGCPALLDATPVDEPCPQCGGNQRDATVGAAAGAMAFAGLSATVQIGHTKQGSWQQEWMDVEWLIVDLEKLYGTDTVSNVTHRLANRELA
jgi:hypothetical protein